MHVAATNDAPTAVIVRTTQTVTTSQETAPRDATQGGQGSNVMMVNIKLLVTEKSRVL